MNTSRPIVYIAGPYRGPHAWAIELNIRGAEEIGFRVAQIGAVPLIPHTMYRHFQNALPDAFWLAAGIDLLRKCDAIVMGYAWRDSSGSRAEHAEALRLGLPIFEHLDYDVDPMFKTSSGMRLNDWTAAWMKGSTAT